MLDQEIMVWSGGEDQRREFLFSENGIKKALYVSKKENCKEDKITKMFNLRQNIIGEVFVGGYSCIGGRDSYVTLIHTQTVRFLRSTELELVSLKKHVRSNHLYYPKIA